MTFSMTPERRVILDTSVVVSALILPASVPRRAFDAAIASSTVLVSDDTIAELNAVLQRRRFDRFLSEAERFEFLAAYLRIAETVKSTAEVMVCRDPKDNMLLSLAVDGEAHAIVSGDADLLALHPFSANPIRPVTILPPRDFLNWIQTPPGPLASPAS